VVVSCANDVRLIHAKKLFTEGSLSCHDWSVKVLAYILVVLSLVVLGAHFLRYGNAAGVALSLAPIALLFVRKPWAARVVQVILVLGAIEWARTLYELAQMRLAQGMPAARLVIILGAITILTAASALLFETQTIKRIYRR
jgi:hypothetical protein